MDSAPPGPFSARCLPPERRSLEIFRLPATGGSPPMTARALVLASLEQEIGLDEVFEDVGGPAPVTA